MQQTIAPVDLDGRVALVTGGGRGLGAATARMLAEAGAAVAVLARTRAAVADIAEEIRQQGQRSLGVVADVGDWESVRAAVDQIHDALGPILIVVNNAAIAEPVGSLATIEPDRWAQTIAVNLNGPFFLAHATLPDMLAARWGRIINVTSGAAKRAFPSMAAYGATKAGLNNFTQALDAELRDSGVVAVAVDPSIMETSMQTGLRELPGSETERFRQMHAQGRLRSPTESAALIRWLCGPEGEAFRGQVAPVTSSALRARIGLPDLPEDMRQP